MKVFQTQNQLIIKENPGCLWLFGLFFVAFGILFIYGAFNGFVIFGIQVPWAVSLTFILGTAGIAIGVWVIYKTPIHHLVIDKNENEITLVRWGIFGKVTTVYKFDQIERFCLIERQNNRGGTIWNFGMELTNEEKIPITSLGNHVEDYESKYVYPMNVFIGKQTPFCELILESPDESADEMS